MKTFPPGTVVRVLQEDWGGFRNLPRHAARFEAQTGVRVDVTLTHDIEALWKGMIASFTGEASPFDLVGLDDLMLIEYAHDGLVEPVDAYVAADGYDMRDFEPAALDALSYDGRLYGIPSCHVANLIYYRADLFEQYGIGVPETMDELTRAAVALQDAVRRATGSEFYGFAARGIPRCGYIFWTTGSTWCPAWGARWYDADGRPTVDTPEHLAALEHYVDLLRRAGPPSPERLDWVVNARLFREGKLGMVMDVGNEAAALYDSGDPVTAGMRTMIVPAGPLGTRHAGLYAPPYAIPARSRVKEAAWDVAKFLTAPEQLLDDALASGGVEVARRSLLDDSRFVARFRPDLIETVRATRPIARGERPISRQSFPFGDIIAEEQSRALAGEQTPREAVRRAQARAEALGPRW